MSSGKERFKSDQHITEDELERQFQEELERAKALSMETQALEEFKKKRMGGQFVMSNNGPTYSSSRHRKSSADFKSPNLVFRSNSVEEFKSRPRPAAKSTTEVPNFSVGNNNNEDRAFPHNSQMRESTQTIKGPLYSITDDLISWGNPMSKKCDEMKTTIKELYKSSSNQPTWPGSQLTPLGGSANFQPPQTTGPASLPTRTVFPSRNEVGRFVYDVSPQNPSPGTMQTSTALISPELGAGSTFGSPMVKSLSLTAFPHQTTSIHGELNSRSINQSVSAQTSPVHQFSQKPPVNRSSNYSFVSLPPRSRAISILPDKPKIGTPKTQVKLTAACNNSTRKKSSLHCDDNDNLMDFSEDLRRLKELRQITKVSVLEAFDPLHSSDDEDEELEEDESVYVASNKSDNSFYETHDAFEYMATRVQELDENEDKNDRMPNEHQTFEDQFDGTILSPRHRRQKFVAVPSTVDKETVERRKKEREKFYERTEVIAGKIVLHKETDQSKVDPEVRVFVEMVSALRSRFVHNSKDNLGIILSPKIRTAYPEGTSVKFVVRPLPPTPEDYQNLSDVKFTCDVTTSVEHVLWKVIMDLEEKGFQINREEEFVFAVAGSNEYILCCDSSKLDDFDYVHRCYKFDRDVELTLVPMSKLKRPLLRTVRDDEHDVIVRAQDISTRDSVKTLSYDDLKILMETLDKEASRVSVNATHLAGCTDKAVMPALRPKQVIQAAKMVCALLGNVETIEVTEMCDKLSKQCVDFDEERGKMSSNDLLRKLSIADEVCDKYATVTLHKGSNVDHAKLIQDTLTRIKEAIQKLVEMYTKTFRVNFSFESFSQKSIKLNSSDEFRPKLCHEIAETLLLRIGALHRLKPDWTFEEYMVTVEIYHGTRPIMNAFESGWHSKTESFYERVVFDDWIDTIKIRALPRESRLVLNLHGRKTVVIDKKKTTVKTDIGWAALQLFTFERYLAQGSFLLTMWPSQDTEKQVGPAPDCGSHPYADVCPLISFELPELTSPVLFPEHISVEPPPRQDYNFKDLDFETQQKLLDLCDLDIMSFNASLAQDREIFWEKRYYLTDIPGALPKVLLAANAWDYRSLPSLYGLIQEWKRPGPMDILQLFLPCFPDTHVREVAIEWLGNVSDDDLKDFLPQLVEAVKHETWSNSPLARLLLERSLSCPAIAHSLYWLLTQSLPGQSPQNSSVSEAEFNCLDESRRIKVGRYRRRLQMLMRALYHISGEALQNSFLKQQELVKMLHDTALEVKQCKDQTRSAVLDSRLTQLNDHLGDSNPTMIPLSPGLWAHGVDPRASSYFPSNTLPLKLAFLAENSDIIPVIFKVGDDLRQDQLTIQMIRLMDKLWLREGLDLKMVTFSCVPTGYRHGMVEMITEAKTLREIQLMGSGRGVAGSLGSFKDTPINEWLIKHNPSQLEFATAVSNFTHSCAGYSIATYILGICDRHNDNIMVKQSGHLFHIDFGKFLGDAQMFGSFKRDRTPFVLTSDMLHVINGGDRPTQKFHDFVDLCCKGFNIIRKHGNLILNLFTLMASSGIPGVTLDAVSYVQRALLPDLSSTEAAATFARFIEEALGAWFTQINFFLHNLAQLKFGDNPDDDEGESGEIDRKKKSGELLSFIPKTYSMKGDGRIEAVQVYGIQKRYRPEKHYVFILKITRENEKEATFLFRTYKEFCELSSKLNRAFPTKHLLSLEKGGLHFGRQEIQEVAERRKHEIASFLERLFQLSENISHSKLVYTFFHPLLRDQEETDIHIRKLKEKQKSKRASSGLIQGQLKLSLEYRRNTLMVMVCHAKDLALPDQSKEEPNSYVKVYLHPDAAKETKRKTRVIHKNCHPSFMEMLEYRMPWDAIRTRTLQAVVWDTDRFQENLFLGAVEIPLGNVDIIDKCVERWYHLKNLKKLSAHG